MTNIDNAPAIGGQSRHVLNTGRRGAHHSLNDPWRSVIATGKASRAPGKAGSIGFPVIWFTVAVVTIMGAAAFALRYGAGIS